MTTTICQIVATRSVCQHAGTDRQCGAAPGSCQHQRPAAMPGMQAAHTSGYLRTVDANVLAPAVPAGGLDLESNTPLTGGACSLDGACEACQ